jgi:hypothetical protein
MTLQFDSKVCYVLALLRIILEKLIGCAGGLFMYLLLIVG